LLASGRVKRIRRLLALTARYCASCHDQQRAQASGGKFVLLQGGQLANLTPESLGKVIDALATKTMPKGGNMPDADRLEMISSFVAGPR
jgi:mono/diheme cytochrome c family protein